MSIGDQQAGQVVNLVPFLNHYFASTAVLQWVQQIAAQFAAVAEPENGGDFSAHTIGEQYALLDRRGGAAIWELASTHLLSFYVSVADGTTQVVPAGFDPTVPWLPGQQRAQFADNCDPDTGFIEWDLYSDAHIYFMTLMLPWQSAHMRGETPEIVVAIAGWGEELSIGEVWALLTQQFMPEQTSWVVDMIASHPEGVTGSEFEIDPIYMKGADR